jgi:hypothetical protein
VHAQKGPRQGPRHVLGQERIILAANPSARMAVVQPNWWWDFIGKAMIERGEIVARMDLFKDISELGYQPL